MRNLILMLLALFLSGCGTMITVPLDSTLISEEEATVIVFHEQGFADEFKIFLDRKPVGIVTSEQPLKFSVTPGEHEIHSEVTAAIDRITKQTFRAGETYYMLIWLDIGTWASSIRIDRTNKRDSYTVRSHK